MEQSEYEPNELCGSHSQTAVSPHIHHDIHLIWKLKGTGKKSRRRIIDTCEKGQQVFIICDSDGDNCTVITETGDELGRLTEKDAAYYHKTVEKHPHTIYIKRIHPNPNEKPSVKILILLHQDQSFAPA